MMEIRIKGRAVGPGKPTYVIAEMSGNHNQSYDRAVKILEAAKAAGADAVKLQTYTADTITLDSDAEPFQVKGGTLWDGQTLHRLYQQAYTPWEWHPELMQVAERLNLHLFSTPFDPTAVDFLEDIGVPAYKIASPELIDLPLVKKVAETGKPMIVSTGMATVGEIEEATGVILEANPGAEVVLLKCTTAYPTPPEEVNLRTMQNFGDTFDVPYGLSDHTMGTAVAVAAVSLGACVVEKHFCLSRNDPGPDTAFSMEPEEFSTMVGDIRTVEQALGTVHYGPTEKEIVPTKYRRSLFVAEDIQSGEQFTEVNVRSVRPGQGLHPKYLEQVIGCVAKCSLEKGTPLQWNAIELPAS
jgi:pseudaminic acid synthase